MRTISATLLAQQKDAGKKGVIFTGTTATSPPLQVDAAVVMKSAQSSKQSRRK